MATEVRVHPDAEALSRAAAAEFARLAGGALQQRGYCIVALAGGSTPRGLYRVLAADYADRLDWSRIHLAWGDERCVPPGHPQSNYRMAREAMLDALALPPGNVHRVPTELPPEDAARAYEAELRALFGLVEPSAPPTELMPRFDLMLLGMGTDGHTASLFPGAPVLRERERWVAAYDAGGDVGWRVTLTPVALNAARHVIWLVSGPDKAAPLREVLHGPHRPHELPAQIVRPQSGEVLWLVDAPAAARL